MSCDHSLSIKVSQIPKSCEKLWDFIQKYFHLNSPAVYNSSAKNRLTDIEDKLLENNMIIAGVNEDVWETNANLLKKVINLISYTVDTQDPSIQLERARVAKIVNVKRIGTYSSKRGWPISVQFEQNSEAKYFWENKGYLPENIHVRKQYSDTTEDQRRILRPVFNAAKKHPDYKGRCKMDNGVLILKGKSFTPENVADLPTDLDPFSVTSRSNSKTIGFFGELNPLSNYHKCNFTVQERKFLSTEQFIQYTKACHFNDINTAAKILQATNAMECKNLSRQIALTDEVERWSKVAPEKCLPGIQAKFQQNPKLKKILMNTGTKTIVESSYDKLWGTRVPIHSQDCLNNEAWTSTGILGNLLMQTRESLSTIPSSNTPNPT